jgi:hypothetical protein
MSLSRLIGYEGSDRRKENKQASRGEVDADTVLI